MNYTKKIVYQSNYWYNDGLRKAQSRDMSGAIESLRRSLQFNRENIAARNLLGLVYYGIGEVPEALVEWIISKNLRPRDNIANYFIKEVQDSAAELEAINQAIRKFNQCLVYCRQDGEDLAVIQLKQIVAAHPTFLKAWQLQGLLYLRTDQYTKARQSLRNARKLDQANETTLRFLHELTRQRGRRGRRGGERKKKDAVEYSLGNETIIQPRYSRVKELTEHLAVSNLFIGAAIGAAIIWFLVAPAVNQSSSERLNNQMRDYSSRIQTLESQISAQTRTLDEYRASGEAANQQIAQAQATVESYDTLLTVSDQYHSGGYSYVSMADTLLGINRDSLGDGGKVLFDSLTEEIYPSACRSNYNTGREELESGNYQQAVTDLSMVIQMDPEYREGGALFYLAQAYMGSGDNENAAACFRQVLENYGESQYAEEAQENLDAISGAEDNNGSNGEDGNAGDGDNTGNPDNIDNTDNTDE